MKKRGLTIILAFAALLLSLTLPFLYARADVVWEPEDDFYNKHSNDCTYLSRSFYTNGDDGFLSVKREPGVKREVAEFENGEIIGVAYTYDYNGKVWGLTEFRDPKTLNWKTGWVPMDQLLAVYDYISFSEDHSDEFFTFDNSDNVPEAGDIVFWKWPGSGEVYTVFEEAWQDSESYEYTLGGVFRAYKDSEDRVWGFIGYSYGARDVWVCLSDPSNREIPAFNPAPEPVLKKAGDRSSDNSNNRDQDETDIDVGQTGNTASSLIIISKNLMLISILVSAAALVTVVLILLLRKRKK